MHSYLRMGSGVSSAMTQTPHDAFFMSHILSRLLAKPLCDGAKSTMGAKDQDLVLSNSYKHRNGESAARARS